MKFQGTYKFRTEAIPVKVRLLFSFNQRSIPASFEKDQVFHILGDTNGFEEIFRHSFTKYNYLIYSASLCKVLNKWMLVFAGVGGLGGTEMDLTTEQALEVLKQNCFLAFVHRGQIIKRYPEPSINDIYAGWLLENVDYNLWESSFFPATQERIYTRQFFPERLQNLGGGIFGYNLKLVNSLQYSDCLASIYFTYEQAYSLRKTQPQGTYSNSFNNESYLHPVFGLKKAWEVPGLEYVIRLFSEDRKELIYTKVDNFSKKVYYAIFDDNGNIVEDNFIVDLSYYDNLPLDHPDKLNNGDPIPELPFWLAEINFNGITPYPRFGKSYYGRSISNFCRFKKGKIEWIPFAEFIAIEPFLQQDYIDVSIVEWDGQTFANQEVKKYKKIPTRQDLIDVYKTSNLGGLIEAFSLEGIVFS